MIIFCPKDGGSWSVDLSRGGVSIFCPGGVGVWKKCRPPPPLWEFFSGTALIIRLSASFVPRAN